MYSSAKINLLLLVLMIHTALACNNDGLKIWIIISVNKHIFRSYLVSDRFYVSESLS
jgi:hypothetical protein